MSNALFSYLGGSSRTDPSGRNLSDLASLQLGREVADMRHNWEAVEKAAREKAEHERKAAEATIELNQQTKIQNQILRDEVKKLNESIAALKNGHEAEKQSAHQFDVFISHANDNKTEFVNSLTDALDKLGITIWYDANTLEWGDNWKLQITNGLKKCRFGVVVISPPASQ